MVRHLKRDVLTQLKPKTRYSVLLNIQSSKLNDLREIRSEMRTLGHSREDMVRRKALVSAAYRATAHAKAEEVSKYVNGRIENTEEPFLVFASSSHWIHSSAILTPTVTFALMET